jgi:hypothetical protein
MTVLQSKEPKQLISNEEIRTLSQNFTKHYKKLIAASGEEGQPYATYSRQTISQLKA